jgi:pimeloyl-ACP methyl ester carboxylesterase
MAYATRHLEHPSKLIILSASARLNLDYIGTAFERLGGREARAVAERFWREGSMETGIEYVRFCTPLYFRTPQDPLRDQRAILNTELTMHYLQPGGEAQRCNFLPDLLLVRCPTLVMGGEDDPVTTIDDMADIARALPPHLLRFERIANCGHGPFFDAPDRTIDVIREFIAAEEAA